MITSQPSISIIIPAFNTEMYISACLESVFRQVPNPDQVIIVDDGSTDNTAAIIDAYKERLRVTILHTENQGPGLARNIGMRHIHTDYVHFLDSDDMLVPDFVAKAKKIIIESGYADLILFSGSEIDEAGAKIIKSNSKRQPHILGMIKDSKKSLLRHMQDEKILRPNIHTLGISKVSIWRNNNIEYPKYYHEDEAILYPFISSLESAYVTNETMYIRRMRASSIMTAKKSPNHALGALTVAQHTLAYYMEHGLILRTDRRLWKTRIANYTIYYMRICREIHMKISYKDILMIVYQLKSPKLLLRVLMN